MLDRTIELNGIQVPRLIYGTAWKEEATQGLVELAIRQGFRGIDTANQRRHYFEAAVGEGISAAIQARITTRKELFLQSKYTSRRGQDHRLPYDPDAPVAQQVEQSLKSSLRNLYTDWLDSFILHGPTHSLGLSKDDWAAWQSMESLFERGQVKLLGISNVSKEQLELLCQRARVKPHFVQNRCYAVRKWDREVREFCAAHQIVYQGFSLLTANRDVWNSPVVSRIAQRHSRSAAQVIFRYGLHLGIIPLTGTSTAGHMRADLQIFEFSLTQEELQEIEAVVTNL